MVDRGNRVLPDQCLPWHEWPEVTGDRTHVAVSELEPGPCEGISKLLRVLMEAPRDLLVGGIEAQRKVCGQHGRHLLLRGVVRVRDHRRGILRLPLLCAGWTLRQLPLVLEQVVEEVVAPLRRGLRPRHFRTARNGVSSEACTVRTLPSQALILDPGAFRL